MCERSKPGAPLSNQKYQTVTDHLTSAHWQLVVTAALTHFEVETRYDGELLHCQLFGGLLVAMATAALDFGTAS